MNLKITLRVLLATILSGVLAGVEQWLHNGKPIPSTDDQWREFAGVLGVAIGTGVYHLLVQSPINPAPSAPASVSAPTKD